MMSSGVLMEGLNMHDLVGQFLVNFGERFTREGRMFREQIKNYERTFTECDILIPPRLPREPQVMRM